MERTLCLNNERYRTFTFVLYPDSTTYDVDLVIHKLCELKKTTKFVALWICHDKDKDIEGVQKKVHYHFAIKFENKHYCGKLKSTLGIPEDVAFFEVDDFDDLALYFLHYEN